MLIPAWLVALFNLARRYWRPLAGAAAVLVVYGACRARDLAIATAAAAEARAEVAEQAARARLAHADTVYARDTVRLVRWRARYDTLRATDTVTVHDTVYVRKALADATLAACTDALQSCEVARGERDSLVAILRSRKEGPPTAAARWRCGRPGVTAGLDLHGRLNAVVGVGCTF